MSGESSLILDLISSGSGFCLDLGGNKGALRRSMEEHGYQYINLDMQDFGNGEPSIIGDAHKLPFKDRALDVVISKDTLEHFIEPSRAVNEVHRVLKQGGKVIIWVPFMHPFHGNDFYRYTPLGLKHLLREFEIVSFDSPLRVFSVIGLALVEVLRRMGLGFAERPIKRLCRLFDFFFAGNRSHPASFAAGYRIVAHKPNAVIL
jgi:SAM-dependent methyltransferase